MSGPDTAVSQARIQQSHRPGYSSLKGPGYSSLKGPDTAVSKAPDTAVSKAAHPQFESLVEAGDPLAAAKDAGHIRSR